MKINPGYLDCIGDYTTNYMGILISQYKDPYKPTSIMESRRVIFVAHLSPTKGTRPPAIGGIHSP